MRVLQEIEAKRLEEVKVYGIKLVILLGGKGTKRITCIAKGKEKVNI